MKLKAAIYCRLSKEDVEKENRHQESESIINQTLMLLDYIEQQGFALHEVYKDDDYSGLYDDRPGFEKLIRDARAHKFDLVVAKSQSRFTRNIEHLEKYLHHDFPLWGIRFISVVDHVDTGVKGNKKARQINGLINEWYCEDLSDSIKASFRVKQKKGQFLGASAPYGYKKDKVDKHRLVPDPYAAEVVRRIFQMYLSGIGKAKIGEILTREGILIPTEYKREILNVNYHNANQKYGTDSKWSFQTINLILHNEVYTGNLIQNKCCKKSYKDKAKKAVPKEEWIRVKHTHEPIIDRHIFRQVQEQLEHRSSSAVFLAPSGSIFSGKLFCDSCGKPMTPCYSKRNKQGDRYRKYVCSEYKKFGNKYCSSHSILEETLRSILLQDLRIQARQLLTEQKKEKINQLRCICGSQTKSQRQKQQWEELKRLKNYKLKAFEQFADGILDKAEYIAMKETYEKKEKQLQQDMRGAESDQEKLFGMGDFETWLELFIDDFRVEELTKEMVLQLIESIHICEGKEIKIKYRFSFK